MEFEEGVTILKCFEVIDFSGPSEGEMLCHCRSLPRFMDDDGTLESEFIPSSTISTFVLKTIHVALTPSYLCPEELAQHSHMEYSNEISVLQGRKRYSRFSCSNFDGRITHSEHGGQGLLPPPFYNNEGDTMMDGHDNHPLRYTPYEKGHIRRRRRAYDTNNIHIKLEKDLQAERREIEEYMQSGIMENWFKVTIPFGRKYDKAWLINSIKTHCSVPFSPVDFHCIGTRALFFVQHEITASAIKEVSKKISDEDSLRIPIFVSRSTAPYSVQNKLTSGQMEQLQLALRKRYDVSQQALNLERLRFDPEDVASRGRPECSPADGQDLCSPNVTDFDLPKSVECCKEVYEGYETLKNLILQFLQEYYLIYDYGDRRGLLNVYHEEACFSLTIPLKPEDRDTTNLHEYTKYSRNVKNIKEPSIIRMLLKYGKSDIVDSLSLLPRTQHDYDNFMVDMFLQTEKMLCFSVHGVFKEIHGKSQGFVRAFTRTFIATPGKSTCLCIVNDHLLLRNVPPEAIHRALSLTMAMPCCSSMSTLTPDHLAMVQAFSMQSRMKLEWSQKCLEDNQWDYSRAAEVFIMLQMAVYVHNKK
ncbi:nuclear RNA export factor 2-like [Octodon degus]|uniref:Tip-associated protein n=1 Tax=Octodon degus TaxID=10160 RepID=A0A6P6DGL9_OCTDE|nr:nuclear RNA export factor 2-like [Octodon degus]